MTVRDDGRGIAREVIDRVLERAGVGQGGGTGLGLANVNQRLIAHYGESVRLRSFPFGTVVRLEVPIEAGAGRGVIRALLVDDEAPARARAALSARRAHRRAGRRRGRRRLRGARPRA